VGFPRRVNGWTGPQSQYWGFHLPDGPHPEWLCRGPLYRPQGQGTSCFHWRTETDALICYIQGTDGGCSLVAFGVNRGTLPHNFSSWATVQIHHKQHATDGVFRFWLNGELFFELLGNTDPGSGGGLSNFYMQSHSGHAQNSYSAIDDIAINDPSGSV